MSSPTQFDVIVVGAGVEGSATAHQLISNGAGRVLLLEQVSLRSDPTPSLHHGRNVMKHNITFLIQFSSLHARGSSGGSSRITRRLYNEPFYVHMMDEAFKSWDRIERECGEQLYVYVMLGCSIM